MRFFSRFFSRMKIVNKVRAMLSRKETFAFSDIPESLDAMRQMPQADLNSPYKTAALTVCSLCAYTKNKENGIAMLNFLRGERQLSTRDIAFLNDRFVDGQTYIPYSFFAGSVPANDYKPNTPYKITIKSNQYSDANSGYKKLFVQSGGADSLRAIILRQGADGKWYLWEQELLSGIRAPQSQNFWAKQ